MQRGRCMSSADKERLVGDADELEELLRGIDSEARAFVEAGAALTPQEDLARWISTALERELMVTHGYSYHHRKHYLALSKKRVPPEMIAMAGSAIASILKDEESHARNLLEDHVVHVSRDLGLDRHQILRAQLRGHTATWLMMGVVDKGVSLHQRVVGWVARLAFRIIHGVSPRLFEHLELPHLLRTFSRQFKLGTIGYFRLNEALEQTAVDGYRRMAQLLGELPPNIRARDTAHTWLQVFSSQEKEHRDAFRVMGDYFGRDDFPPGICDQFRASLGGVLISGGNVRANHFESNVTDLITQLERLWASKRSGSAYIALDCDETLPHFYVLLPSSTPALAGHMRIRSVPLNPEVHPELIRICDALGEKHKVNVAWDKKYDPPAGVPGSWLGHDTLFQWLSDIVVRALGARDVATWGEKNRSSR